MSDIKIVSSDFLSQSAVQTHVDASELTSSFQDQFTGFSFEAAKRLGDD
jgi:hypothetical protein